MSSWLVAAILFFTSLAAAAAQGAIEKPIFTADEQRLIARNQTLSEGLDLAPKHLRRLLDTLPRADQVAPTVRSNEVADRQGRPDDKQINPLTDPDMEGIRRSSPEAAHDLFQVIKQSKANRAKGQK